MTLNIWKKDLFTLWMQFKFLLNRNNLIQNNIFNIFLQIGDQSSLLLASQHSAKELISSTVVSIKQISTEYLIALIIFSLFKLSEQSIKIKRVTFFFI
jgi:hypothetical protein